VPGGLLSHVVCAAMTCPLRCSRRVLTSAAPFKSKIALSHVKQPGPCMGGAVPLAPPLCPTVRPGLVIQTASRPGQAFTSTTYQTQTTGQHTTMALMHAHQPASSFSSCPSTFFSFRPGLCFLAWYSTGVLLCQGQVPGGWLSHLRVRQ